jgi:hypothetical protein
MTTRLDSASCGIFDAGLRLVGSGLCPRFGSRARRENTHLAVSRAAGMGYLALPLRGRTRERKRDGEIGFYQRAH